MSKVLDLIRAIKGDPANNNAELTNTPPTSDNSKKPATTQWCVAGLEVQLATNGYIKLPTWMSGLIINWGKVDAVPAGSAVNITFVKPFPNACLNNHATINNTNGNGTALSAGVGTPSLTGMGVFHNGANPATAITWWALGH